MSGPASRRGFLRGLTTLPLIGGGVALIGTPTAVAEPCTDALLDRYSAFLATEYREAMVERRGRRADMTHAFMLARGAGSPRQAQVWRDNCLTDYRESIGLRSLSERDAFEWQHLAGSPSSRAALVLSAIGAGWQGEGR